MTPPATPIDESARLDALRSLDLLDTPAEERFDRLTRLARRVFGVPTALISLIDGRRQWFKTPQGLGLGEIPRSLSFCGHTILADEILVVPDARLDPRFHDNPLVLDAPHIRFYAGCPLAAPGGSKVGTLCLIDTEPRTLGEGDLSTLRDLAHLAERELAAARTATLDDLTLLWNRRGFLAMAQQALSLCARMERPTWLHFFDLDGFKAINDGFGPAAGDRTLVAFGAMLMNNFRDADVVGRLGNDQFVVLVTNCSDEASRAALQRLQKTLDAHNAASGLGVEWQFSVGAVQYQPLRHCKRTAIPS